LDTNPTLKDGTLIDDLDLATMENKPWRSSGADLIKVFFENFGCVLTLRARFSFLLGEGV